MCERTIGILLAAGRSRRMGEPKQLLPWRTANGDTTTIVAAAYDTIAPHCERMVVTVGAHAEAVRNALGSRVYQSVSVDPDAETFASVTAAMELIDSDRFDVILLHPADIPEPASATIATVLAELATVDDARAAAVMPEHGGRGGHPVVFSHAMISQILEWRGEGGLRAFWEANSEHVIRRISVDDAGCVRDMDTRDDYEAASAASPDRTKAK